MQPLNILEKSFFFLKGL